MMRHRLSVLLTFVAIGVTAAQDPCAPVVASGSFAHPTPGGGSMTVFDSDGPGANRSALVVSASFNLPGFGSANIAKWDGRDWTGLGTGLNQPATALESFDEDAAGPAPARLFAGGPFTAADGAPAAHVARWNGSAWSAVGAGFNGSVLALAVFDQDAAGSGPPALYAAGDISVQGTTGIARWNGSSWSAVGTGTNNTVRALAVYDEDGPGPQPPVLIAGGDFTVAGGVAATHIAKWNGTTWAPLGTGVTGFGTFAVQALEVFDEDGAGPALPALFVGGQFTTAGGQPAASIARWIGSQWSALAAGVFAPTFPVSFASVKSLRTIDPDGAGPANPLLFVGGNFTTAGGQPANNAAYWTGSGWTPAGPGFTSTDVVPTLVNVTSSALFDDGQSGGSASLFVSISTPGGATLASGSTPIAGIAKWNGAAWIPPGRGANAPVNALLRVDAAGPASVASSVLVGGSFTHANGVVAPGLARWNGTSLEAVPGAPLNATEIKAMCMFDPDGAGAAARIVIAGGASAATGIVSAFDGAAWTLLGAASPTPSTVAELVEFDGDGAGPAPAQLVAGGSFSSIQGVGANGVAAWNGSAWSPMGAGVSDVRALFVWDADGAAGPLVPRLFAGANGLHEWVGGSWTPLGLQHQYLRVCALTTFDPDGAGPTPESLVAAQSGFDTVPPANYGVQTVWQVAPTFIQLGAFVSAPPANEVQSPECALLSFDEDGPGPASARLLFGGPLRVAGPGLVDIVASWDGATWTIFSVTNGSVRALLAADIDGGGPVPQELFMGGAFTGVDGISAGRIARRGVPARLTLALSQALGPGSISIDNTSCLPGVSYFNAFSADPANGLLPGQGWFSGLHVSLDDLIAQFLLGIPPFTGTFDGGGDATFSLPPASLPSLPGVTLHGVTHAFVPSTYVIVDHSSVAAVTLN